MNNKLIFFSIIILATQLHGMKRSHTELQQKIESINFPNYALLPKDIQNIVIDFSTHNTVTKKPKDAAKTVRALAVTNKQLNLLINSSDFNRNLINNFSRRFYCSHETIAKYLCTKEATIQLNLHNKLKQLCLHKDITSHSFDNKRLAQELKKLISNGVDLEFTYNHEHIQKTPLMLSMNYDKRIFLLLLDEEKSINSYNSYGLTALQFAMQWSIHHDYYKELLALPDIKINQQNKRGESALLHCLVNRKKFPITDTFIDAIKDLLKAGADPELANNHGLTPLDAAIELKNEQTIRNIQRAIEKKHS